MSQALKKKPQADSEPVRVLGRGLRAPRGVRLTLKGLREASGKTQIEVSRESKIDQGDVSRLEARQDFDECQVATLRRYLEAIGGRLELTACFRNKRIELAGAQGSTVDALANKALQRRGPKRARR
jgi:hypothetical protein